MPGQSLNMGGAVVRSMDDLLLVMQHHLKRLESAHDNRAAFLRVYFTMSGFVRQRLDEAFFIDGAWIERVAVRFAWWYFDALDRYERGDNPPPAWGYAFNTAARRQGFLLQDVLLGMNAHINNDLPLVVEAMLREEDDDAPYHAIRRRFDHDQINRALYLVIPRVEEELAEHYGRLIRPLGWMTGTLDQALSLYGLKTWRENVWRNAQSLLAARTEAERDLVIGWIQTDALHVARSIERFPPLSWLRPLAPLMRRWRLC